MTYPETLHFLFSQLPMYQHVGASAYKANLNNITEIAKVLKDPQNKFKSVHVAGTNGKGSVTHMIASVLQEAGYKVGIYCSPHLVDFRERIKINGKLIDQKTVISFVQKNKKLLGHLKPSFFEYTTALAFDFFAAEKVDIAIVEVGLGGRLDSTNIIHPILSVITNIGIDHTQFLGNSLPEIAAEKAGIIKHETPVIVGEKKQETENVFIQKANQENAELIFSEIFFSKLNISFQPDFCDLKGIYQQQNYITAYTTLMQLKTLGWKIDESHLKKGFVNVAANTAFFGRWQTISFAPKIICDTGHNKEGIAQVAQQLKEEKYERLHIVWGAVNDKDPLSILPLLPKNACFYFCQPSIERALPVAQLVQKAKECGINGLAFTSVKKAVEAAKKEAQQNDLIFVGGSTFVVADFFSKL